MGGLFVIFQGNQFLFLWQKKFTNWAVKESLFTSPPLTHSPLSFSKSLSLKYSLKIKNDISKQRFELEEKRVFSVERFSECPPNFSFPPSRFNITTTRLKSWEIDCNKLKNLTYSKVLFCWCLEIREVMFVAILLNNFGVNFSLLWLLNEIKFGPNNKWGFFLTGHFFSRSRSLHFR